MFMKKLVVGVIAGLLVSGAAMAADDGIVEDKDKKTVTLPAKIAPRKMSDIMGQMSPDAAERLTVELARRAGGDKSAGAAAELPKIEGKMLPQKSN